MAGIKPFADTSAEGDRGGKAAMQGWHLFHRVGGRVGVAHTAGQGRAPRGAGQYSWYPDELLYFGMCLF